MSRIHRLLTIAVAAGSCLLIHRQLQLPLLSPAHSPLPTRVDPSTLDTEIPTPTPMRQWLHRWNVSELALSSSSNDTEYQLQDCLRERWIYIMGDSTGRFFMQALLLVLHRQFPGGFGRYLLFDGRKSHANCTTEDFATPTVCKQHLTTGCGCIREFFDRKNGIRITFIWVITAGEGSFYLDSLVGQDNAPDLFITSVGAWDTLKGVPAQLGAERAVNWIMELTNRYPSVLVVALTPNACVPIYSSISQWIAHFRERMLKAIHQMKTGTVVLFDKEPSTKTMDVDKCDGYHVMLDDLNVQQVLTVLLPLCQY